MNTKTHWEHIYEAKVPTKVSWYQEHAQFSLPEIQNTGIRKTDYIIDVGGGASGFDTLHLIPPLCDNYLRAFTMHITLCFIMSM